jgi:hypothetical protein
LDSFAEDAMPFPGKRSPRKRKAGSASFFDALRPPDLMQQRYADHDFQNRVYLYDEAMEM